MLRRLLGLPKTILFNFYYLDFNKAIRFPIRVAHDVKIKNMGSRKSLVLKNYSKLSLGYAGSFALVNRSYWSVSNNGQIICEGSVTLSRGIQLIVDGKCIFGKNFFCNSNSIINIGSSLTIGEDVIVGWGCKILDGDGHKIIDNGIAQTKYEKIIIDSHVWLASDVTVLKGTVIKDGSIVASNACVTKPFEESNVLIGGFNTILKKNISWEKE